MITEPKSVELQESFQSTSTSKYLESRFLIWNNIGAITCYSEQIQISFHDVSYHHSITIDNKTDKYSLGDLSLSAIILASSQTGKLLCILYQSWDSNMREWTINTENNDKIEMISLADDFIAIGTSQRLIRLMSLSGIQQRIIRLQGPIISISAYQNQLWIIHHSTQGFFQSNEFFFIVFDLGLPKEQAMSYVLLDIENDHYLTGPLPLTPKTKLIWMGCVSFIFFLYLNSF
jgi:chromosome transmission fidelity protein 4